MVKQSTRYWSMKEAIEQIDRCGFECEGGPLSMNVAYMQLKGAIKVGPEFWPGQGVYFEVVATAGGQRLTQWVHFYIVGCQMDSDDKTHFWKYSLSSDPPAPYHYGIVHYTDVKGDCLRLVNPAVEAT